MPAFEPGRDDPGKALLAVLLGASALTVMAGATIAPSLPGLAAHFSGVPDAELLARLALTLPAIFIAVTAPFAGNLIDRIGPRHVLLWSVALYVAGGASGLIAPNLPALLAGRAMLGIAVAGVMTSTTALIGNLFSDQARHRILGYQGAAMAFGGMIFLTLGGWLADVAWRLPFAIYLLPLLLLPLMLTQLPDGAAAQQATASGSAAKASLPLSKLLPLYLTAFVAMAVFFIVPTQLPFLMQNAGMKDASLVGYAIAAGTFASAVSALMFLRVKNLIPSAGAIALMFVGLGAGLALIGSAGSYPMVIGGMLIAGAGAGLTMPTINSLVLDAAPPQMRGRALGGLSTSIFLGQFSSPLLFATLVAGDTLHEQFFGVGLAVLVMGLSIAIYLGTSFRRAK